MMKDAALGAGGRTAAQVAWDLIEDGFALQGEKLSRARRFLQGDMKPTVPRLAASVMLVRNALAAPSGGAVGVQVFVQERARTMAFAPAAIAFPGGGVEADDSTEEMAWADLDDEQWADRLGLNPSAARQVLTCAVRELFEECGILLADGILSTEQWAEVIRKRRAVEAGEAGFADFLACYGLYARGDLLAPKSRWVTPKYEKRRYDTFFFAAEVPPGQFPDGGTAEVSAAYWADPRSLLQKAQRGESLVLPPTLFNLALAAQAPDAETFCRRGVAETPLTCRELRMCENDSGGIILR